jgi:hypothetical protein
LNINIGPPVSNHHLEELGDENTKPLSAYGRKVKTKILKKLVS